MSEGLMAPLEAVAALVKNGGHFVVYIYLAGLIMWTLIAERIWFFKVRLPGLVRGGLRIWDLRQDKQNWGSHQIRKALISQLNVEMTQNMPMLKVMVPLCPLLGLVGTVEGMLDIFDAMSILGSADARSMAGGVSKAMNCTMTGLAVSITGMYPVFYFQNAIRTQTELLADRFLF